MLKGSVFSIKQYEFITKVEESRKKNLLKKAFFLSLCLHLLVFAGFFVFYSHLFKKGETVSKEIQVALADYVPFPSEQKPETKEEPVVNEKQDLPAVKENKQESEKTPLRTEPEFKVPDRRRPDLSWRSNVEKKVQIERTQPPLPSKVSVNYKALPQQTAKAGTQANASQISYARMLGFLIRSHWSVPEDLGHKFYGLSAELVVTIDSSGNIKNIEISRSSGDKTFDYYAKEAVSRTGRFPLPPKDLFATLFLDGKITIEFKP